MDTTLTKSERETLKAIYRLTTNQERGGTAHTGDLAVTLRVTPGTMTATIKRLADRGLVDHTPYRGVELTPAGRQIAVAVIRRHRIVERFLADLLGYGWQEADRLAPNFEHELPQEVEDRLFIALHRPTTCPHGFPIPGPEVHDVPAMRTAVRPRARRCGPGGIARLHRGQRSSPSSTPSACAPASRWR